MFFSTPSYIIPGTWLENIRYIDKNMNDISSVELLFFIYDDETKRLFKPEEQEILSYAGRLGFTLHLPDPLLPSHESLVEKTEKLVRHWIIHPPQKGKVSAFTDMVNRWKSKYGNRFLLENLAASDTQWFIKNTEWPLCLDTGHMLVNGNNPSEYLRKHWNRIGEIHLHDVINGKDHSPLSRQSMWIKEFIPLLETFGGIINIELFSSTEITESLGILKTDI